MKPLPLFNRPSTKDLNLLPEEEVGAVSARRLLLTTLLIPIVTLVFLGLAFILLFLLDTQQAIKHSDLAKQIQQKQAEWSKYSEVATGIAQIKTNIQAYQAIPVKNQNLRSLFDVIRDDLPITLTVSKIDLSQAGQATVEGVAPKAADIDQYLQVLKNKTESYSSVTLKAVNYNSSESNYRFVVTFLVKAGQSQKNQ
jgi:hypothetical protein